MSRTKEVYSTGEIAHLWANQAQKYARNPQGNFYFQGRTLYSYGEHHAVAALYPAKGICLFNDDSVSNTTAGHHSLAYRALDSRWDIILVPRPDFPESRYNIEHLVQLIVSNEQQAVAPRKMQIKRLEHRMAALRNTLTLHKYCKAFKLKSKVKGEARKRLKQSEADIQELLDGYGAEYQPIKEEYNAKLQARQNARDAAASIRYEEMRKARERTAKENEAKWREGDLYTYSIGTIDGCYILRLKDDRIETSGGAKVGLKAAKLVWKLADKCRKNKAVYAVPPEKPVKIDFYSLSRVDELGNVVIGCHKIEYIEMANIAKQLEW